MCVCVHVLCVCGECEYGSMQELVLEKETRIRESMLMMGLQQWVLWTTWFIKQFILLFISAFLATILLKVGLQIDRKKDNNNNSKGIRAIDHTRNIKKVSRVVVPVRCFALLLMIDMCNFLGRICLILLRISQFGQVFPNSDFFLLLIFFILFIISAVSFCFFLR